MRRQLYHDSSPRDSVQRATIFVVVCVVSFLPTTMVDEIAKETKEDPSNMEEDDDEDVEDDDAENGGS